MDDFLRIHKQTKFVQDVKNIKSITMEETELLKMYLLKTKVEIVPE